MPSIGHIAVGLATGRAASGAAWRPMLGFAALSMLPDVDVISFRLGIPYEAPFGHRGASHSLLAACCFAGVAYLLMAPERGRRMRVGVLVVATAVSHGLLDACTDGGKGIALLWPWTNERFFAPWRPIPVAPIGVGMLTSRGIQVAATELLFFLPFLVIALWPRRATVSGTPR